LIPAGQAEIERMPTHPPEDWPRQFTESLNAGDLDAAMEPYEPDARFVAHTGETVVGRDRIRDMLADLVCANTRLQCRVIKTVAVDDIALLYSNFEGTTADLSGTRVELRHNAIEVLRRQPDGAWKLIVGDPGGRRAGRTRARAARKNGFSPDFSSAEEIRYSAMALLIVGFGLTHNLTPSNDKAIA
jgi:uncharacterized protein (TIGR02246 family)